MRRIGSRQESLAMATEAVGRSRNIALGVTILTRGS